ncbi:unnamed protein product [Chironomus riparius]|uniref:RING-type E3 ubiquitin transferase n=1 Tax=Chironomus riparius TaxID=315576 RepID=A0A9N9S3K9_9DIPT|nr:unnamed protein product [Chironomus riparius]
MGVIFSRLNQLNNNNAVEETEIINNYKYPPKSGNYFSSSFIMGGERFDQSQPEAYLFGENSDLNFLQQKPTAFPYQPPKNSEPTKTLKSFVNVRKESVKFVKSETGKGYNVEFVFDSDLKCFIKIYYFATEEITNSSINYVTKESELVSDKFQYEKGANQTFSQPSHIFFPNKFQDENLQYDCDKDIYPIVIHCVIDEPIDSTFVHSHTTICVVDHHTSDGEYHLRAMKQKIFVDGLCYLLQEIYGIENKNLTRIPNNNDDDEDTGSECVICICEPRDTLILPCKHLCLCNSCADSLRYQANNCPICRSPFRALLQIRAVQKSNTPIININQDGSENIPLGFMPIPLIEALNGPIYKRNSIDRKDTFHAISEKDQKSNSVETFKMVEKCNNSELPPLLSPNDDSIDHNKKSLSSMKEKKGLTKSLSLRDRDCVKYINERASSINELDDDSEAEKLSPLLVSEKCIEMTELNTHGRKENTEEKSCTKGEDSDYFTPEDPEETSHTILSPVKNKDADKKETRTPLTHVKDTELPDSPHSGNSQVSTRSGDSSYSSSSSTRQLLSSNINEGVTANTKSSENNSAKN